MHAADGCVAHVSVARQPAQVRMSPSTSTRVICTHCVLTWLLPWLAPLDTSTSTTRSTRASANGSSLKTASGPSRHTATNAYVLFFPVLPAHSSNVHCPLTHASAAKPAAATHAGCQAASPARVGGRAGVARAARPAARVGCNRRRPAQGPWRQPGCRTRSRVNVLEGRGL